MFNFNFFKRRATEEAKLNQPAPPHNIPPVELFVDDTPPREDRGDGAAHPEATKLAAFLGKDYGTVGRRDGYLHHAAEALEMWKRKARAEFQLVIDQTIQGKYEQRYSILNHLDAIGAIHETTAAQLRNAVREIEADVARLTAQKELSAVDEGWIMNALHSYQLGFTLGLTEYVEGENLLQTGSLL